MGYGECTGPGMGNRSGSESGSEVNRLGEAIGKPVANLHGRVGQSAGGDHREKAKKTELRFPVKRPDFS